MTSLASSAHCCTSRLLRAPTFLPEQVPRESVHRLGQKIACRGTHVALGGPTPLSMPIFITHCTDGIASTFILSYCRVRSIFQVFAKLSLIGLVLASIGPDLCLIHLSRKLNVFSTSPPTIIVSLADDFVVSGCFYSTSIILYISEKAAYAMNRYVMTTKDSSAAPPSNPKIQRQPVGIRALNHVEPNNSSVIATIQDHDERELAQMGYKQVGDFGFSSLVN